MKYLWVKKFGQGPNPIAVFDSQDEILQFFSNDPEIQKELDNIEWAVSSDTAITPPTPPPNNIVYSQTMRNFKIFLSEPAQTTISQ